MEKMTGDGVAAGTRPPREAPEPATTVVMLKALSHPVRLRIVDLIRRGGGGICVCQFEKQFDLTQPTITHHLKILREAGLLRTEQKGTWVHHFINAEAFAQLEASIGRFARTANASD